MFPQNVHHVKGNIVQHVIMVRGIQKILKYSRAFMPDVLHRFDSFLMHFSRLSYSAKHYLNNDANVSSVTTA